MRSTTCDFCNAPLADGGERPASFLALDLGRAGGEVAFTARYLPEQWVPPLLTRPHHFCGFGCLRWWLNAHHPGPDRPQPPAAHPFPLGASLRGEPS